MSTDRDKPAGWQWTHERDAELIMRDGLMCEQHPGLEFDHDGCAGPGMAWLLEGRDAVATALADARAEVWKEAIGLAKSVRADVPDHVDIEQDKNAAIVATLERAAEGGRGCE